MACHAIQICAVCNAMAHPASALGVKSGTPDSILNWQYKREEHNEVYRGCSK